MELAALALTDAVPGLIGEEALAERERIRAEGPSIAYAAGYAGLTATVAPAA